MAEFPVIPCPLPLFSIIDKPKTGLAYVFATGFDQRSDMGYLW